MLAYGYLPAQGKSKAKTEAQRQRHNQGQALSQSQDGDLETDSSAQSLSSPGGRGVPDFWLKLLLSDYDDDSEYSSKREYALFHELFVWTPRFIDGVEVVVPGSGKDLPLQSEFSDLYLTSYYLHFLCYFEVNHRHSSYPLRSFIFYASSNSNSCLYYMGHLASYLTFLFYSLLFYSSYSINFNVFPFLSIIFVGLSCAYS